MNAASILITTFQQWSFFVNAQVITVNLIFINKTTRPFIGDFFLDAFSFLSIFFVILQFLRDFFLAEFLVPWEFVFATKCNQIASNNQEQLSSEQSHKLRAPNFIHIVRFSVLYRNFCSRFTSQSNLIILSWQNVCASNESMKHAK